VKYKVFFFLFFLFLLVHLYISYLNPESSRLYVGNGKYYETTIANYIAAAFVFGVIISIILSFFGDIRRAVARRRQEKAERKKTEITGLFEKGRLYEMKGETEKAAEYFNRAIRTSPQLEEPYLLMADMHISRKEFDKARDVLEQAQRNLGKKESLLFKKIKINLATKDMDRIEEDAKEILKISESNLKAMAILRDVLICRKEWDGALELEKRLRKQIKTEDENRRLIGIQYERAKQLLERRDEKLYEQIAKDLREITNENKHFVPAYLLAADVYKKMGKLNDAGRVYGRGYSKTGHMVFLQRMEDLYINRGEPAVILKIYRRLLEVAPKNQLLIFLYARLCLRLEMIDEAIELLSSLLTEEKEFRGLHRVMAEGYLHRGDLQNAVDEFVKAFPISSVYMPFYCEACQTTRDQWSDFCENCFSWNTINVKQEGLFQKDAEDLRLLYEQDWGV
jgi:tetratricopeptide (TPR) repeat protein